MHVMKSIRRRFPFLRGFMRGVLPRSLFGRSMLILVLPVLLIQVITTYVFFDRHWDRMTSRLGFAVAGEIAIIADQIERSSDPETLERIARYSSSDLDLLVSYLPEARLQSREHDAPGWGWGSIVAGTLSHELEEKIGYPFAITIDRKEEWVVVRIQLSDGLLVVELPQRRLFSSSGYIFLLWMLGISIVLLGIAVIFMRNQIRPIRRLAVAADRFGKGRDMPAFKPEGAREVRQAAQAFLNMHERINRQIAQRTAMLAGVSHDLRTPLTRMKLQLAMFELTQDTKDMLQDIEAMEKMITGYLDFARGAGEEQSVRVDFPDWLRSVVGAFDRDAAHPVHLDIHIGSDRSVLIKPVAFERCLVNLFSNARKYGDHIWVSVWKDSADDMLRIMIEDDGPAISPELYEEVFKPFYRVDSSRNSETGGVGLGLPVAMDIVHGHGGRIWLEQSARGGLAVHIRLPL